MTIFQTQLNLLSILETETTEQTTANTIFLISAQKSHRETLYQRPKLWNNLKNDTKIKKSIFSLKKTLKKKLLEKDSQLQFFRTLHHP